MLTDMHGLYLRLYFLEVILCVRYNLLLVLLLSLARKRRGCRKIHYRMTNLLQQVLVTAEPKSTKTR